MNIRERAQKAKEFAEYWKGKGYEKGQSQIFWIQLLQNIFEVENISDFIEFEEQVHIDKSTGFIDAYIPSTKILIEQKSVDKDLTKAIRQSDGSLLTPFQQAKKYVAELPLSKHPRYIVTCNFKSFLIYDMEKPNGEPYKVLLENLETEYYRLQFLVKTGNEHLKKEMEISIKAGDLVAKLYELFLQQYKDKENEQSLKSLNKLCVRLVFCLYAEDADLFGRKNIFHDYLNKFDAVQIRSKLIELFKILNTPEDKRDPYLEEDLQQFPYVNGGLFSDEEIEIPTFTEEIKQVLLAKAADDFDWSQISPTIFGAVFESTLNPETRRNGGMHYTSIENIHKVIDPLFLNDLKEELEEIKVKYKNEKIRNDKLLEFQSKISKLKFLDSACGSGNFLTETYISLREIENEIIEIINKGQIVLDTGNLIKVGIHQFYGIEINDFAVTVAKTALWIAESQMMKKTSKIVHTNLEFLPLKSYANIVEENALRIDWNDVIPNGKLNYIMGNPPFVGARLMNESQKEDVNKIFKDVRNSGNIDYVGCWYVKSAEYMKNTNIQTALVSTNSITQGEQTTILWKKLIEDGIYINFAYKTFRWDSEASLKAHVHCIIVGFSYLNDKDKFIYDKEKISKAKNINGYLIDAPNIFIESRNNPINADIPKIGIGNKPIDDGNYLFTKEEMELFIKNEPNSKKYFKIWLGAQEFINRKKRYCLFVKNCPPDELRKMPHVLEKIENVKAFRLKSKSEGTIKLAETPLKFHVENIPTSNYLLIPRVSSERRKYIPMGYINKDTMCSDSVHITSNASLFHFGILTSNVHMAWTRVVCGRLEMRYRYSKDIVYNNFPWPNPTSEQKEKIEETAQEILDARALYPNSSLADLYDELTMPVELRKAHQENDKAVMEAYGFNWRKMSESDCVAELMKMYQKMVGEEDIKSRLEKALNPYIGMTQLEIYKKIEGKEIQNIPKNIGQMVTNLILDKEKIEKDDIVIKNISVDEEWKPLDRMSFRTIKLNEFEKDWNSSDWKKYFENVKMYIVCYEGSTKIRNGYRKLKGVKYIEFDKSDLDSFMISYNMVKDAIKKKDIKLLPYPSSYDKQYLEVAPKGQGGINNYNNFLKNNSTQVCFILNKNFLENKICDKEILYDKPVENTEIVLSKFLYTVDEIKVLFDEKSESEIDKILSEKKYRKKDKYLIKEEYYDFIEIKDNGNIIKINEEILSNNSIRKYFENECKNYNLFELNDKIYITKNKIEKFGFSYVDIDNSVKEIENEYKNENNLFSINNIFHKDFMKKYKKISFSKELFEKILNKRIKTLQIGDELLYTYSNIDINDIFERIILKYRIITINEIRKIINEEYEIEVSNSKVRNYIINMEFYYNEILDKVYADKNDYYEEVYDE